MLLKRWCSVVSSAIVALGSAIAPWALPAQVIHGTVSSAVGAGRIPGAVVLLLDSTSLTTYARALTSDSGAYSIRVTVPGRYHLKVMRIGFRPTVSQTFDLARDSTIDFALTDIPVVLPAVTTRDRSECRLHPDTSAAGLRTFAIWDDARTALHAAAITAEGDYRFDKVMHVRLYDVAHHELRDVSLRETLTHGAAPWSSLPAEELRARGYATEDDSGATFWAPDLDVLLSPYFSETHCFRLTTRPAPSPAVVGIDFEPAGKLRHVEIGGTLWVDSTTKELESLVFSFVNLPISASDTLLGGRIEFVRLTSGGWIIPSWSIRMPTPIRRLLGAGDWSPGTVRSVGQGRGRYRYSAEVVRISGADLRSVRRAGDDTAMLWRRPAGSVRVHAVRQTANGTQDADSVIVRLVGSPFSGYTPADGRVLFSELLPGTYLFEASTPLLDVIEATALRTTVTVKPDTIVEARVSVKPLLQAAREVCDDDHFAPNNSILAGHLTVAATGSPLPRAKLTVEWDGGSRETVSRQDGYYRICGVPRGIPLVVRTSADGLMVTKTVTLERDDVVRRVDLPLLPQAVPSKEEWKPRRRSAPLRADLPA
jgi:hypothetical protein